MHSADASAPRIRTPKVHAPADATRACVGPRMAVRYPPTPRPLRTPVRVLPRRSPAGPAPVIPPAGLPCQAGGTVRQSTVNAPEPSPDAYGERRRRSTIDTGPAPTAAHATLRSRGQGASPGVRAPGDHLLELGTGRAGRQPRAWAVAAAVSVLIHTGVLLAARWLPWPPAAGVPQVATSLQVLHLAAPGEAAAPATDTRAQASARNDTATRATASQAPSQTSADADDARTSAASAAIEARHSQPAEIAEPQAPAALPESPVTASDVAPAHSTEAPAPTDHTPSAPPRAASIEPAQPPVAPTPRADALAEQLARPPVPKPQPAPATKTEAAPTSDAGFTMAPAKPAPAADRNPSAASLAGGSTDAAQTSRRTTDTAHHEEAEAPARNLSGLAALDAEIAAARRARAAERGAAPASDTAGRRLSGLAALDAEIAAERRRSAAEPTRPTPAPKRRQASAPADGSRSTGRLQTSRRGGADDRDTSTATDADGGSEAAERGQAELRYLAALRRALSRERHYPPVARRRGLEGTARVQFTIAADGAFSGIRVSRSAGAASLDDAAAQTVRQLARFDPIPPGIGRRHWTVRVPIVFRLN